MRPDLTIARLRGFWFSEGRWRAYALAILAIGLLGGFSWAIGWPLPIRFDSSLGFICFSVALLGQRHGRRRVPLILGICLVSGGALLFLDAAYGPYAAIDGWLFRHRLGVLPQAMTRPVFTSLDLFLSGVALILIRRPVRRSAAALSVLSSVILALALIGFFFQSVDGLPDAGWAARAHMSSLTAGAFFLAGLALLQLVQHHSAFDRNPRVNWLPPPIAFAVLAATMALWQTLLAQDRLRVQRAARAEAALVKSEIATRIEARALAVMRVARWSERWDGDARAEWGTVPEDRGSAMGALQHGIGFLNARNEVQWIFALKGNEALDLKFATDPTRRQEVEWVRKRKETRVGAPMRLAGDRRGFLVYQPFFRKQRLAGIVIGLFDTEDVLAPVLSKTAGDDYVVEVRDGVDQLLGPRRDISSAQREWALLTELPLYGSSWELWVCPTEALLARERNGLPRTVLLVGIVLAILLTRVIRNAQSTKKRAEEAEHMNRLLAEHISEREKIEATLEQRVTERTSELSRANADLIEAREAALGASRLKSEFVANMSHEIRTPINAIIGTTNLLFDSSLDREQQDYVETIKLSSDALLTLVNDILDFSKIEAGKMSLEIIDFDLSAAVHGAVDAFAMVARERGLQLRCDIAEGLPKIVKSDPGRLRQVLTNLVGNALKFTERGSVDVSVSAREQSESSVVLEFHIRDTGIGIPPAAQRALFQSFSQADASTTRRFGGTGLGLSISKRLVELLHGKIGFRSEPGQGSDFWFELPVEKGAMLPVKRPARLSAVPAKQSGRILVVDDTPMNLKVTIRILEKMGYRADPAGNGAEALAALAARRYDLVLMDCQMPEMDGYQATQELRKREADAGTRVPVLAMTANALAGERDKCVAAGMDDYLSKPLDIEKLNAMLRRWLKPRAAKKSRRTKRAA